jgi:hypothetical protein
MKKMRIAVIAAIAVLGVAALGGVAVRANAETSPSPDPAAAAVNGTAEAVEAPDAAEAPAADVGKADTDNVEVQEGDQNAADGATEATDEVKAEADGPGGHADDPADANANHEFEGEE